jgi:hypothetical protein
MEEGRIHGQEKREADCRKKKYFRSRYLARRAARGATYRAGRQINFYSCPVCQGFHITSQEKAWKLAPDPVKALEQKQENSPVG